MISVHGRTYKQAFTGKADFLGIHELKQHLDIPVLCNGDILDYDDGLRKIVHPENLNPGMSELTKKNLDGFMIGRASFGNPWCFLPGKYTPTLGEILDTMTLHGKLLWEWKNRKGMMEARKHLVQYLHGFPGVKEYRSALVHVESVEDIERIIEQIRQDHTPLLSEKMITEITESQLAVWECGCD